MKGGVDILARYVILGRGWQGKQCATTDDRLLAPTAHRRLGRSTGSSGPADDGAPLPDGAGGPMAQEAHRRDHEEGVPNGHGADPGSLAHSTKNLVLVLNRQHSRHYSLTSKPFNEHFFPVWCKVFSFAQSIFSVFFHCANASLFN